MGEDPQARPERRYLDSFPSKDDKIFSSCKGGNQELQGAYLLARLACQILVQLLGLPVSPECDVLVRVSKL